MIHKDKDCKYTTVKVELKINNKKIKLKPFVRTIIYSCVLGLLRPLKEVDDDIKDVNLILSRS